MSIMRVLFVDPCCPKPYDPVILDNEPLGGSEATVVRVAEALALLGCDVRVTQHNRTEVYGDRYFPFGTSADYKPTHVVVLRATGALAQARKQFPNAKMYLWAHDMFGGEQSYAGFQSMCDTQTVPIVVSEWHKMQMYDVMRAVQFNGSIPAKRIYNPIAQDLVLDATPTDINKLVFFSSPHKGLEHTLKVFERFQDFPELKDMRLFIANPGYFEDHKTEQKNVINLGALSHSDVISQVRSALCVFHLNNVYPETFGLVHAESNAVGTPFMSSRLGATPELADHPGELIDVQDPRGVIERIKQWRGGRPKVRFNPNFRIGKIAREWKDFLGL
jgi:glycosyltransferase involved in cell wall biosynthesis